MDVSRHPVYTFIFRKVINRSQCSNRRRIIFNLLFYDNDMTYNTKENDAEN